VGLMAALRHVFLLFPLRDATFINRNFRLVMHAGVGFLLAS
jgi:hypothetical protein